MEDRKEIPYDFTISILEWFVTVLFCIYFITFANEFSRTTVYHPRIIFDPVPELRRHTTVDGIENKNSVIQIVIIAFNLLLINCGFSSISQKFWLHVPAKCCRKHIRHKNMRRVGSNITSSSDVAR